MRVSGSRFISSEAYHFRFDRRGKKEYPIILNSMNEVGYGRDENSSPFFSKVAYGLSLTGDWINGSFVVPASFLL